VAVYFMHLRNGTDELLDPEGKDFASIALLKSAVLAGARDLMAGDIKHGIVDLRYRIDAEDADGAIVYSLDFAHALNIIPEAA
jgi:hypothetical protein